MSCGLGAIILVFMLVKHNVDNSVIETELLQNDLDRLQSQERELRGNIASVEAQISQTDSAVQSESRQIANLESSIAAQRQKNAQSKLQVTQLEKAIEKTDVAEKEDVIENENVGEQNYLMGLKVEGRKIAIMMDASASMTDESLIDIIRRKNSSDAVKRQGPKWKRSRNVVKWLLARLPRGSDVTVLAFNATTKSLGGAGWQRGSDARALTRIYRDLDSLTPTGATNLQLGLNKLAPLHPSDLYIITDGLPTDGESNFRSLNPFADCSALWGKSNTISGECRTKLFRQTIADSAPPSGVKVNIVLLPIEGDPEAAPEYWAWTAATGGLLISPAESWP